MGSFKVKLVVYFLLLSLLPLAAAFWGFSTVAARSETRRVDARLQAGLRAALATYQDELVSADEDAARLARSTPFQRALKMQEQGAKFELLPAQGSRLPMILCTMADGTKVTGKFTLAGGRIAKVTTETPVRR